MPRVHVTYRNVNYALTGPNPVPAPAGMQRVTGMEAVGLSRPLAKEVVNNHPGETFGVDFVGSPDDVAERIAGEIHSENVWVYR